MNFHAVSFLGFRPLQIIKLYWLERLDVEPDAQWLDVVYLEAING